MTTEKAAQWILTTLDDGRQWLTDGRDFGIDPAAAPDLLTALREAERTLRWAAQEARGRVDKEKVGGWIHHADKVRAAIAKAVPE